MRVYMIGIPIYPYVKPMGALINVCVYNIIIDIIIS